jgi:hypothetical protein
MFIVFIRILSPRQLIGIQLTPDPSAVLIFGYPRPIFEYAKPENSGLQTALEISEINPCQGVDGPEKLRIMRASCRREVAPKAPSHNDTKAFEA